MSPADAIEDRLYKDAALAQFYELENGWGANFDFCLKQAEGAGSTLDLGCGTGELTAALAEGRSVVSVDPAVAMLAIARQRPGGNRATWVEGDARTLRLDQRFDLTLLTGHAFQVFLSEDDLRAVLATIAGHLAPGGRFLFDSRNPPAVAWRAWTAEKSRRSFEHPDLGRIKAWNDVAHDADSGIASYQTCYRIAATGEVLRAASQTRFTPQETLAALIDDAGSAVDHW